MSDRTNYLVSCALFLSTGMIILRVLVRNDYQRRGRLSIAVSILQALVWFFYGGFPILYLPEDWPVVQVSLPIHILGLAAIIFGLGFTL